MSIISRPREIRVQLDPSQGFPVSISMESGRYVEDGGKRVADLPAHIESLAPDSPLVKSILGELASAATTALFFYQAEVQRLAVELGAANKRIEELEDKNAR